MSISTAYERLRESWGMLFINIGAAILLKHKESYKIFTNTGKDIELIGELQAKEYGIKVEG